MSRITFRSPSESAELRGSERAHMGILVAQLARVALSSLLFFEADRQRAESVINFGAARIRTGLDLETVLSASPDSLTVHLPDGRVERGWYMALNTALAFGSDTLTLLARLHGQCEIHAWVDGPNRAWLADLIDAGRATGLYRPDEGWEGVAAMLRRSDREPVVTYYSVTDSFPNPILAGVDDDEEWYGLSYETQWARAFAGLRDTYPLLELDPMRWRYPAYFFGEGVSAYHVTEAVFNRAGR